jgi:hypothetical protein
MNYERPFFKDLDYSPQLFYAIFGVDGENLNVSRERHRVDELPNGLNLLLYSKADEVHAEYMKSILGGSLGKTLRNSNERVYEAAKEVDNWAVIRGCVTNDANLHYMRNTIGFVQALAEKGAMVIADLFTLALFTPSEWADKIFKPEFEPRSHVVIFVSETDDAMMWIHTRGMIKFGRPDVSMEDVPRNMLVNAEDIINQMIFYSAQGAFFSRPTKFHIHNGLTAVVKPYFIDNMENPDFNNSYYRMSWAECEIK